MRFIIHLVAALCCAVVARPASAVELSCFSSRGDIGKPCPRLNPLNGHYYAMGVPAVATWDDARAAAESFTLKGVRGHLATITSAEESDFLNRNFHLESLWIGASDAAIEGEWRWVVGPEAGELFWLGAADGQALGYANWGGNEPNGFTPDEDYAEFNSLTTAVQGTWNDYTSVQDPNRFLVEFSVVPEPSSYALLTIGGAALAIYARQRRRRT